MVHIPTYEEVLAEDRKDVPTGRTVRLNGLDFEVRGDSPRQPYVTTPQQVADLVARFNPWTLRTLARKSGVPISWTKATAAGDPVPPLMAMRILNAIGVYPTAVSLPNATASPSITTSALAPTPVSTSASTDDAEIKS